jgi:hypothetical protein
MSPSRGLPAPVVGPVRVSREQALSHADLHRLLPRLVAPAEVSAGHTSMLVRFPDGRRLEVVLEAEIEHRIGGLRLRSTRFTFEFYGWREWEIHDFLAHCERSLQQGGG